MKARHGLFVFLIVLLFLNLHVYPAFATVIFSDGFESGDLSAWTGTHTGSGSSITVQSTLKYLGNYAAQIYRTGVDQEAYIYKDLGDTYVTSFFRAYFRSSVTPASGVRITLLRDYYTAYSGYGAQVRWWNDGGTLKWEIWVKNDGGDPFTATSTTPTIQADTWYCIELKKYAGSGTSGEVRLYVDGVERASITGDFDNTGKVNRVLLYHYSEPSLTGNFYYDCAVVADAYIGPEGGAPTQYTFYGEIPLTFTLGSIKGFSFVRHGTIPLTFTFLSTITQAIIKNFYGSIPLTFSIDTFKAITFNLFGNIPLTFTFEGTATFTHGILLRLYGTVPLTFAFESLKAINLNIFGSIPIQFAINGIAQYITKHLFFYGTIPLQFILPHTISGLPEIAIDWGMAAMGMAIVAFTIAIVAFTTRKT